MYLCRAMTRILIVVILFTLAGCRNELELNAPYREIPSVYAVLNPQDSVQTIRINKVFLGEGDANVMARVSDSVNYAADEITVTLTRFVYQGSVYTQVPASQLPDESMEVVFKEQVIQTSPGAFSQSQRVYVTTEKLFSIGDYVLTIRNNRTGNVFTAKASAFEQVNPNQGFRPFTTDYIYPYPPGSPDQEYIDYTTVAQTIRFRPNDARIYQLTIRVHYYDSLISGNKLDYVDYDFAVKSEPTKETFGTFITYKLAPGEFFTAMGVLLDRKKPSNDIIGRKLYMMEYFALSSSREYEDFLKYNSPSFGITQQTPIYSNFENRAAIGIFTFRTRSSVKKQPSTVMINEFSRNKNTCAYRFLKADGTYAGCQ
jgi:hypothetical protein